MNTCLHTPEGRSRTLQLLLSSVCDLDVSVEAGSYVWGR